jgi:hypothetical protein
VKSPSAILNPELKQTFLAGLANFIHGPDSPASGDELTFFMATEVLRRAAPAVLLVGFSDVEVAHSGTYSLHISGIRREDKLVYRLWQFLQSLPDYRDHTTMVVMPEFGRPGRLQHERILQPPHQHRMLPAYVDGGAGKGGPPARGD